MHSIYSGNRKSGISSIGGLPWGSHFCQFYETGADLIDILVPYFKAGLENNEFCVWAVSRPLRVEDAKKALKKAVPQLDEYAGKGRIEVIPHSRLRAIGKEPAEGIVRMLDKAISSGFDGLRIACNALPERKGSRVFTCYGADEVGRYNVIAAFAYPRDKFDAVGLMEVVKKHRLALVRSGDTWEVIESSEARIVKDALKRSEEKLQSLFCNMSEGFAYHRIVLDSGGKPCDYVFLEINDAFEKLTGLKAEKIIGREATEVLPGLQEDPTDWIGKYGKVALTGKPIQFESYSEALRKWYSVSAFSPHKGYFAVTFSDITERKLAEEVVHRSRESLRVTLSSIGDAVIATDAFGQVTFLNSTGAELTGWSLKEALGQPAQSVFRIINEKTRKPAENIVERVLREGAIVSLANDTALITRDGGEIPIEDSAAPIRDNAGNIIGVVLVFHDVTEKRRSMEALRRYELLAANTRDIIVFMQHDDGRILEANAAAAKAYGYNREELLDLTIHDLRAPHAKEMTAGQMAKAYDEGILFEAFHRRRDGSTFPVEVSSRGSLIDGKRTLISVVRDITERRQMEEELRKSHDELELRVRERTAELNTTVTRLEQLNQELQEFAHVASHDLQEPLRKIQTFCDMAQKRCAPVMDDTSRQYLDRVLNSAGRMRQLLQDLLAFSRVATKPEPFRKLDLGQLVREAADIFEASVRETGCQIEINMPAIEADETQMLRLFQNLIGNSLKFRAAAPPRVKIYGRLDGQGVCEIHVKDNGIGFDQKFAELIFKPFQRLHGRSEYDGTGMGLAICRKIVERHGGSIRAESVQGKGSTFIIRLPVKQINLGNISSFGDSDARKSV